MLEDQFVNDIRQLRVVRAKLNITQKKLAEESGVSQSLVTKIENGNIVPSWDSVIRIRNAISRSEKGARVRTAGDICNPEVVSLKPGDSLTKARRVLKENEFSQAPVIVDGRVIGTVKVNDLSDMLLAGGEGSRVEDILAPSLPVVDAGTPADSLRPLLKRCSAVLVSEKGVIVGIITPHDVI